MAFELRLFDAWKMSRNSQPSMHGKRIPKVRARAIHGCLNLENSAVTADTAFMHDRKQVEGKQVRRTEVPTESVELS